ncbi:hypothetical protein H6P81_020281 [Aristolochia fimbriata]|uniref:rhamnogalacturonan endolyase n=1 Tax=Aristolochia fimbriata TaxID=158543 RepID=A0AAV7DX01_ARIFI|nr:hypothetical protein H6P81_020281 [Aristolochia fimbriata]
MEITHREYCWRWGYCVLFLSMVLMFKLQANPATPRGVKLQQTSKHIVIDNGIVTLTLLNPHGSVTGIKYNGVDNLMESEFKETNRGYWDLVWSDRSHPQSFQIIMGTEFRVIRNDEDQVEVSFTSKWNSSGRVPLNIDKRYVMLRGSSGFYAYAMYERFQGWPGFRLHQTRFTFKLREDKFQYVVVDDTRHHVMPSSEDMRAPRGRPLAYKEAVHLVNPTNPKLRGIVDDKYQFSMENKEASVHGWISSDDEIGFWVITPSQEFRAGGPMKQELTSHSGPTALVVFQSGHYSGDQQRPLFSDGEPWKKVYGPVFFYLNRAQGGAPPFPSLWKDAKKQMKHEVRKWPYSFPTSPDFPESNQRGAVHGRLLVMDRYFNGGAKAAAASAYVGLALPGQPGSWQSECKGYQFWTRADEDGSFSIKNVREGTYNLYAFVPGYIGDYRYSVPITISAGEDKVLLGDLVYEPPRNGPTLWEIGVPDRQVLEFFIPDPDPKYYNPFLRAPKDRIRQYGLWDRYTELYPNEDPIYTVGSSDYRRDWFFAHVPRKTGNGGFKPTTRKIRFRVDRIRDGNYTIRVAIASSHLSQLKIRLNRLSDHSIFSTRSNSGQDNAVARHGLHGLQELYSVSFRSSLLITGINALFFTQTKTESPFQAIMYDYIRLEGPPL